MSRRTTQKIEILVGMIGSGKSTYARRRAAQGAIVICHDDLTEAFHREYTYKPELRDFYRSCEELIAVEALEEGLDVIIDRTHLTRESRNRWLVRAALQAVPITAVLFPIETPEIHALRRFRADPRGRTAEEWLMVARHHAEQAAAEPFNAKKEGFASVFMIGGFGGKDQAEDDQEIVEQAVSGAEAPFRPRE
jgi:predicted kinase